MQRWQYWARTLSMVKDFGRKPGFLKGQAGHPTWCIDGIPLQEALAQLGDDGWELVGTANSFASSGGSVQTLHFPDHLLFFKRPKA